MASIIFIIGVAGSGKTTVGQLLAARIGIPFIDGDDFHSAANKDKMAAGIPLNDEDRFPWLKLINEKAVQASLNNGAVIACSGLKQDYRTILQKGIVDVQWVFLEGDFETIHQRLLLRKGHYMKASMLASQFDLLEKPTNAFSISIELPKEMIVEAIVKNSSFNQLGIIGMGVMGKSIAQNFGSKGICLSLYNRYVQGKEENVAQVAIDQHQSLANAQAFEDINAFVMSLASPRIILLMINAGEAIDATLNLLKPILNTNDLVIDGGNSYFLDTARRVKEMNELGLAYIGAGISGGEEGALKGASMMIGGDLQQFKRVKDFFELITVKDKTGKPCMGYIGPDGAGHFVKMVHNGIEYAEMQLIADVYFILRKLYGETPATIADIFEQWNNAELKSYLLEITIDILRKKEGGRFLIDDILGIGESKGTGTWATLTATKLGSPAGMMTAALFERFRSSQHNKISTNNTIKWELGTSNENFDAVEVKKITIDKIGAAYQLARIVNHHQGFALIDEASKQYGWTIDKKSLAGIWVNGCIIRSALMEQLAQYIEPSIPILDLPIFKTFIEQHKTALSNLVALAINNGLAVPVLGEAIQFINGYFSEDSAMNIIQAQRDYFGAHKVILKSDPLQQAIHVNWK
jgi:6-phosphogluconate dehydrogenase